MTSFYTTEQLGQHQATTPEGFLVIRGVPLARTGLQLYAENEVPVKAGRDGIVYIMRDEEEVFRPETIASLQGKPITIDHPAEDVVPKNYRDLAVGHVINPRRGINQFDHLLLGDLVVWCPDAIEAVRSRKLREVSVGYEADYEDSGEGRGRQRNILANHLALVDNGRCGAVCRIGDRASVPYHATRDACTCASCSTDDAWREEEHPRGQPGNAGQFASTSGGGKPSPETSETLRAAEQHQVRPTPRQSEALAPKTETTLAHRQANLDIYHHLGMIHDTIMGHTTASHGMDTKERFIQKHGAPYVPNTKTYEGPRGPMKACYMNATQEAIQDPSRTYVEGYITVYGVPIQHAWTVDETGQIYDPTIPPGTPVTGYFGVPFSTDYVLEAALKNKTYGILHHNKTINGLLDGSTKDFKADLDTSALSDDHVAERLAFADGVLHSLPRTNTIDTPERNKLREDIADKLYNRGIENRSQNRTATIILGFPGAGKSTFANPLLETGAIEIDNDNVKALLPEFRGGLGAGAVHKEASAITRTILHKAITNGDDFVWPRVDSPQDIVRDMTSLKKAGYRVDVVLVRVPPEVAKESVIDRYLKTGRYVPPLAIDEYGSGVEEAYLEAKKLADSSEVHSRGPTGGFTKVEGRSGDRGFHQEVSRDA